jgi:transposase
MEAKMGQKKHKYHVKLSPPERGELNRLTYQGRIAVRKLNRVKILLLADENHAQGHKTDQEIAEKLGISRVTAERVRRSYSETGLQAALNEKPRSGRPATITGIERAKITALACASTPEGYARWTLRLLAEKVVELELIDRISYKTVGEILKKTNTNPTSNYLGASVS